MKKKIIGILVILTILAIIIGIVFSVSIQAGTGKLYTNLTALNLDGVGYAISDPTNGGSGKYIWHMSTFDSGNGGLSDVQKNIYCLKGGYGESWQGFYNESPILEYNLVFDLQKDRETLLSKLIDNKNDGDETVQALLNKNGTQYREILWILDNLYIKGEIDKEEFLYRIGVRKDVYEGTTNYYNEITGSDYGEQILTEAEIIAIQRVAIWTFTNGGDFDQTENDNWLRITTDAATYYELDKYKHRMAVDLYKYLVETATKEAVNYTEANDYTYKGHPVGVNIDKLTYSNGKYRLPTEKKDSNYIIGPIKINKIRELPYKLSMTITNEKGVEIDSSKYSFVDANGTVLENVTIKDFAGDENGFYLKISTSLATTVDIKVKIQYYETTKKLWLQGTETTSQVTLNAEQPIAEISREEKETVVKLIAGIEKIETTEIKVEKIWDDNNNQDGLRTTSVNVKLLANGKDVEDRTLELKATNNWKGVFTELPVYENGVAINYTVEEITQINKYEKPLITGDVKNGFIITNKYNPEVMQIPVEKVWDDNNNQDGLRTNTIKVRLFANGSQVKTLELNAANQWKNIFIDVPVYSNGNKIEYTISEAIIPDGYTSKITGNVTSGFTITNTHEPGTTQISVEKVWDDNNNQDGIRPDSVDVKLFANGVEVEGKQVELSKENQWKYIFEDLPIYKNGDKIEYTVSEAQVAKGYEEEIIGNVIEGFSIKNIHLPEMTKIPIEKVWNDYENQDGIRPQLILVSLIANGKVVEDRTVELSEENQWKYTFVDVPVYSNGTKIEYTVLENTTSDEYEGKVTGNIENGFTITNSYTPETIEIPVKKIWVDSDNSYGIRPETIEIILNANGEEVDRKTVTGQGDEWNVTFTELPKYKNGIEIKYEVEENNIPEKYASVISGNKTEGFIITNIYSIEKTNVKVEKKWEDGNNQDGIRPESIIINLLGNGEIIENIQLDETNNWTHIFENLPKQINGQDVEYTIEECSKVEGYISNVTGDAENGYVITNTHNPYMRNIIVNKIWEDDSNFDEIRPISITVKLLENGKEVEGQTITLDKTNNWTYTFENLPVNKNGEEILYTVEETPVPNGYIASIEGNMDDGYTIKNEHIVNKAFDLALRKYIIKINNNELESLGISSRVPKISVESLINETTATYKHRKEPIKVEENDIITYAITIYNEGDRSGIATQIIDQLPTGLIYNPSTTIVSKDADGNEKNRYKATYEASTNKIIFDIVDTEEATVNPLQPYRNGILDSETIEIKCKVIYRAKLGKSSILTNVAWINKAFDVDGNKIITNTVGDDRDSEPSTIPNVNKDNMEDYKGKDTNKDDLSDSLNHYEGEQDDDDFEKIYVKAFDLNLRKFINSVNGEGLENSREPIVDVTPLQNKSGTTAIYIHSKQPVPVQVGDTVIYTIRVYNEGEIDGYASEVKDYLPPYLEYIKNSSINRKYEWVISEDGRIATTKYLLNKEIKAFDGTELDYEDLQIECKVSENAISGEKLTNIAEISEYKYQDEIYPEDVDSESENIDKNLPKDEELPEYKNEEESDSYVPGNEDDDDFEKVYVKEFDLALRKFITRVQENEITTRIPQPKLENGKIVYEHSKEAVLVHVGDVITYTLRIYNEGEIDGYASEITDDIPEYLEYLPQNAINLEYMWEMYDENGNETQEIEKAVKVKTKYLSKENGEDNLIKAFDGKTLYYRDIKIAFKVKDPNSNTQIITNHAQISEDTDKDTNEINDNDSNTNKWNDGEDDQDVENVKVEYFDLSILKFVSKVIVIENGKETITNTGYDGHENPEPVVKVELHKKKLNNVIVKFAYGITVTNEGDIPGYATEIKDYIPQGLKFVASDNPNWKEEGNNIISTKQLEKTLLKPGESKTIEVILTWINSPDNMSQKTNTVEISEDKNEYDVTDRDSTPNNKQDKEDDIDIAEVILAVSTGKTQTYFILAIGLLAIFATGVGLIKKFVI